MGKRIKIALGNSLPLSKTLTTKNSAGQTIEIEDIESNVTNLKVFCGYGRQASADLVAHEIVDNKVHFTLTPTILNRACDYNIWITGVYNGGAFSLSLEGKVVVMEFGDNQNIEEFIYSTSQDLGDDIIIPFGALTDTELEELKQKYVDAKAAADEAEEEAEEAKAEAEQVSYQAVTGLPSQITTESTAIKTAVTDAKDALAESIGDEITTAKTDVTTAVSGVSGKVDGLADDIEADKETIISTINSTHAEDVTKLNNVQSTLNTIDFKEMGTKLDKVVAAAEKLDITPAITATNTAKTEVLSEVDAQAEEIKKAIQEATPTIDLTPAIDATNNAKTAVIEEIQGGDAALDEKLVNIQEVNENIKDTATAIQDTTESINTKVDTLDSKSTELETKVDGVQNTLDSQIEETTDVSGYVTNAKIDEDVLATQELVKKGGGATYPCIEMTETTATIEPNKLYVWGEVENLTLTLADPTDTTIMNEYKILFKSGETATTLTFTDSEVEVSGEIGTETIVCGFIINKKAYIA